ncbi:MAG: phosphatase PAP2 family protein [Bacteroidia bacterium]
MFKLKYPKVFLLTVAVLCLSLLAIILTFSKEESFMMLQASHSATSDGLMSIITEIANGLFVFVLCVVLLVGKNLRLAIILFTGFAVSGIAVQTLKNTVYKSEPRPVQWFKDQKIDLEVPPNLKPHAYKSFPSGHSTSAAILFTFFAFRARKNSFQMLLALMLFFVAYSRIYLFQHFPKDVFAGISLGLLTQISVEIFYANRLKKGKFLKQELNP